MLLEMAAPDAIARLPATPLERRARSIWDVYFHEQQHSSLAAFMMHVLSLDDAHIAKKRQEGLLIQVSLNFSTKAPIFLLMEMASTENLERNPSSR